MGGRAVKFTSPGFDGMPTGWCCCPWQVRIREVKARARDEGTPTGKA
jgi:hypothetical protein